MQVIDRLKLELNNKEYFTDVEYTQFLTENNLAGTTEYDKSTMQRDLLYTVVDVLEALGNDIDLMRKVQTEFATVSEATKYIEKRIESTKKRILAIPDDTEDSCFSLMFTRIQ